ncbi:MAG TPA: tetratricopeptide repeat protein [Acidobacteriaceae bacterium]|nr:tetratricopeptide repeat protein [Acidobacteriaceae bacterium]
MRLVVSFFASLILSVSVLAQQQAPPPEPDQAPPRSDTQKARDRDAEANESSSRDTRIDISPPKDDAKDHPNSSLKPVPDAPPEEEPSDVQEMHPWNPYRAVKDDEVGDFYFKRGNYRAALARYQDALQYKDKDAVANYQMARCYEKLGQPEEAVTHYKEYLKILPQGPFAKDAKKALSKLEKRETSEASPKP